MYSKLEEGIVSNYMDMMYPQPEVEPQQPSIDGVQLAAGPSQTVSDAGGSIGPIPRNKAQEALGFVGEMLTKAGVQLDKVGVDIPGLGNITLKDLTVGDAGKVLEDMSYGFYPVRGGNSATGGIGTYGLKPDPTLELMNIAPAAVSAAKAGVKAGVKGAKTLAPKAGEMVLDSMNKLGSPVQMNMMPDAPAMAPKPAAPVNDMGFYSAVEQAALNIQRKSGTGQAMLNDITKGQDVKLDEVKWIGLDDFLKGKKNVTREEVQQFIAANKVDVQEVTLGGDFKPMTDPQEAINYLAKEKGLTPAQLVDEYGYKNPNDYVTLANDVAQPVPTKFKTWTLPGGENYREILLTMPGRSEREIADANLQAFTDRVTKRIGRTGWDFDSMTPDELSEYERLNQDAMKASTETPKGYKSSHWEQPNVLAHIRVNDRVDADGKKMLLVEEVQSDWHQAGRDKGYIPKDPMEQRPIDAVPDAPMKDTWYQLALKRVLKYAADNGYERVGLTTGSRQAERYNLSKQIDAVTWIPKGDGTYDFEVLKDGATIISKRDADASWLKDNIGKELAQKIVNDQHTDILERSGRRFIEGNDLSVGGEGMKKYYDEVYPQFLAKYGKKWGSKVGETYLPIYDGKTQKSGAEPIRFVDITPEMRQGVGKGQPLFSATAAGAGTGAATMQDKENK